MSNEASPDSGQRLSIRIDWSELDTFNHVNNVAYFKYIQAARVQLCESIGLASQANETKPGFMVASTQCEFKRPLNYPGSIVICSCITHVGNTSFKIHHEILDHAGQVAAIGQDALVVFDFHNQRKLVIDDQLRLSLNKLA